MSWPATVKVLQHDPDLAAALEPRDRTLAGHKAIARLLTVPRGRWIPGAEASQGEDGLGFLVLDGVLVRSFAIAGRGYSELLGAGDVLRPWPQGEWAGSVEAGITWRAVQRARLAILDRGFARRVAPWPDILTALGRRALDQADSLSLQLAVRRLGPVEDRLLLMLRHVAGRWGTVTRQGVEIRFPLTHELLAAMIGVRRPSVTVAVHRLVDAGLIEPAGRSTWLVRGTPPQRSRTLPTGTGEVEAAAQDALPAIIAA